MSYKILIDANIFLRFYDTKYGNYKNLLEFLEKISDRIFVTKQIKNEVQRNKVGVTIQSFKNIEQNLRVGEATALPPQFEDADSIKWNDTVQKIAALQKDQKEIFKSLLKLVSEEKDNVSLKLSPIFRNAVDYTEEEFTKAERRKKLGIPPGKKEDPIGDELTWVQFLETVGPDDKVLIVTQDGDYVKEYKTQIYLNPVLLEDLLAKGVKGDDITVFVKLIDFYTNFKDVLSAAVELSSDQAEEISKEEEAPSYHVNAFGNYGSQWGTYSSGTSGIYGTGLYGFSAYSSPLSGADSEE